MIEPKTAKELAGIIIQLWDAAEEPDEYGEAADKAIASIDAYVAARLAEAADRAGAYLRKCSGVDAKTLQLLVNRTCAAIMGNSAEAPHPEPRPMRIRGNDGTARV